MICTLQLSHGYHFYPVSTGGIMNADLDCGKQVLHLLRCLSGFVCDLCVFLCDLHTYETVKCGKCAKIEEIRER